MLIEHKIGSGYAVGLVELLFSMPIVTSKDVQNKLGIKSKDTLSRLLEKFVKAGIIEEVSGKKRYKKYMFSEYIDIIKRGTEL